MAWRIVEAHKRPVINAHVMTPASRSLHVALIEIISDMPWSKVPGGGGGWGPICELCISGQTGLEQNELTHQCVAQVAVISHCGPPKLSTFMCALENESSVSREQNKEPLLFLSCSRTAKLPACCRKACLQTDFNMFASIKGGVCSIQ